jgi:hypothetical protein
MPGSEAVLISGPDKPCLGGSSDLPRILAAVVRNIAGGLPFVPRRVRAN